MKNKKEKNNTLINRIFSRDEDEELKKLKELKKKVKKIKTVEELEQIEDELDELGILEKVEEKRAEKKKKKKRKTDREIFEERVRVNLDIINRTVLVGKIYESKQRDEKIQKLLDANKPNNKKQIGVEENLIPSDRVRDKNKEMQKLKEEIERENQKSKAKSRGERSR